jgi:hypothetical protein
MSTLTSSITNSRAVKFSASQTRITVYEQRPSIRRSTIWYNGADLKQFREDRKADASKIKNQEYATGEICWWGLERLLVPEVREKTVYAKEQMKSAVLEKQSVSKSASDWAAKVAQKKAKYYSENI